MLTILITIVTIVVCAAIAGAILHFIDQQQQQAGNSLTVLADRINAELPQLQCGECGYRGCRPYAVAIAREEVGIDLCPPGGSDTARRLAQLLNTETPSMPAPAGAHVAFIRVQDCIGCGLCLPVCPTDAIVGAKRHVHHVIRNACVGCRLCLPPCPVDCIDLVPTTAVILPTSNQPL